MNKTQAPIKTIQAGLLALLIVGAVGCVGYVDGGYGGGGVAVVPEVSFYGSYHDGGHWHDYDQRGHSSWGASRHWH